MPREPQAELLNLADTRANANTVFFWVSVGTTLAFEPMRCASSRSPESVTPTLRSTKLWTGVLRSTATILTWALPYWLALRINSTIGHGSRSDHCVLGPTV